MAEVSFYILSSALLQERYLFACKLIEKAYRNGQFCYILTDSDEQSQLLDDLLWTFRAGSFIPHEIYTGQAPSTDKVILIGSIKAPEHSQGLLFNLSSKYPEDISKTKRILEILDNCEVTKAAARNRYRQYQQAGMSVTTHNM
ncbi:MAG: DNA polymerase III subunit chi [Methylococcales bacterium]|nr:DNA polymerase III subunit chi [Methylococcales bacterium]RIZ71968.1 MAG: DNA polymerase III subunit chi [Methylococcales bacterium]